MVGVVEGTTAVAPDPALPLLVPEPPGCVVPAVFGELEQPATASVSPAQTIWLATPTPENLGVTAKCRTPFE